jgi:hypothetical protein
MSNLSDIVIQQPCSKPEIQLCSSNCSNKFEHIIIQPSIPQQKPIFQQNQDIYYLINKLHTNSFKLIQTPFHIFKFKRFILGIQTLCSNIWVAWKSKLKLPYKRLSLSFMNQMFCFVYRANNILTLTHKATSSFRLLKYAGGWVPPGVRNETHPTGSSKIAPIPVNRSGCLGCPRSVPRKTTLLSMFGQRHACVRVRYD